MNDDSKFFVIGSFGYLLLLVLFVGVAVAGSIRAMSCLCFSLSSPSCFSLSSFDGFVSTSNLFCWFCLVSLCFVFRVLFHFDGCFVSVDDEKATTSGTRTTPETKFEGA